MEEIIERVNQTSRVTRQDILDVLNFYADPDNEAANIGTFLDSVNEGILSKEAKGRILDDLLSYPVNYER